MTTTIKDVAMRAGLSVMTVSRVLNGERHVSAAAREKVQAAVAALDYRRNVFARGLPGARSFLVCLPVPDTIPDYIAEIQQGAVEQCRAEGYHLVVHPYGRQTATTAELVTSALAALRPDAFLLLPPMSDNLAALEALDRAGVAYGRLAPSVELDSGACVSIDEVEAARAMTAALLALGHRRIGFVGGPPGHGASIWRLTGYRTAMAERGVAVDEALLADGDFRFASGEAAGERLLELANRPTAIFAGNDDMALGVMAAARRRGLSTPRDLSVAGFDGGEIAELAWPQLTTVHQPIRAMAAAATKAAIAMVKSGARAASSQQLDFTLLLRASTAPPP